MSQQQHDMYLDYPAPPNRSPSSSRPYLGGGGGFQSGLSLPRQSQRPFDAPLGSSALYANDRHASGYNQRGMDQLGQQGVMQGGFMPDNPQWSYNPGGVATVNGAMNGGNRQRSVNRRVPIPTNWTDQGGMGMSYSMSGSPLPGGGNDMRYGQGQHDMRGGQGEEQLIPTAIVIKNIPFAPYAFNYHFDNGVFRGLAFANFSSPEDTKVVIEAMNGMDVHGRKLRVEYKKMLPEAERERIEREKRERRGQLEEQHRAPMLHQQPSISTLNSMASGQSRSGGALGMPGMQAAGTSNNTNFFATGDVNLNDPETLEFYTQLTLFRQDSNREILIFPATVTPEQRRQVHILAHHMGLEHQSVGEADSRQIHVVKRHLPSPTSQMHNVPSVGLDYHKKGLIRAATTGDFAEARMAPNNYSHVAGRQGPTLEVDISNNLRAAKSFADLRSFSPSPSVSSSGYLTAVNNGLPSIPQGSNGAGRYAEYGASLSQAGSLATPNLTPTTPGTSGTPGTDDSRLLNSLGGLSIGSFESAPHNQPRTAPGAIGSQRPGAGVNSRGGAPERQPRGPEWETSAGFGGRTRTNGHAQRGSDSSDSGARIAASGAHRYL